jgi:hypothetical protein
VTALFLFSASTLLAQAMPNRKARPAQTATWVLTGAKVIDRGQTHGNLTTGYVVEATATAQGPARINTGKFTIRCTIEDKGAGQFLLRGAWDITKQGAAKTTRHTAHSVKGLLVSKLSFNPAATAGPVEAQVDLGPRVRQAGHVSRAKGSFAGNEVFEGTLTIQ